MESKKNIIYIVFCVVVFCLLLFFFVSQKLFGDTRKVMDNSYNITLHTYNNSYEYKVSNACYDKTTNTMYVDYFIKESTTEVTENAPQLIRVTNGNTQGDELKFIQTKDKDRQYAYKITIENVPSTFYYIRLYFTIKEFDTDIPDTVDEFGNIIHHDKIIGEERSQWVEIDYRNTIFFDSSLGEKPKTIATQNMQEPETIKLISEEPITETTDTENQSSESVTEEITTKLITTKPITTKPVTTKPVTTKPVTTKPVTTKPVTTKPITTKPVTTMAIEVNGIKFNTTTGIINMSVGERTTAQVIIIPTSATNKNVVYESTKQNVADVDNNGTIYARSQGKTIITATTCDGGLTCAIMVVVN